MAYIEHARCLKERQARSVGSYGRSPRPPVTRSMQRSLLLSAIALPLAAMADTYHVDPGGSDANNGLSQADAFATIQHAADLALAGDTVLVHPGNYQGFAAMDHSGSSGSPIVFLGIEAHITSPCTYNGLDGINVENVSWVVIEGFTVNDMPRTGIRTALSDHVTIRSNSCNNNFKWGILCGFAEHVIIEHNVCSGSEDEHGIYFSNSADDPIIRYNHCYDNQRCGIHMNGDESMGGDGLISNAQVYGNTIHGNGVAGGSGINCDGVVGSVFYNNLLYDNHASGISLYRMDGGGPSTNNRVYNNTIVNASDARWCVNIADDCTGNQVLNNILINQHPWRGSIVIAASALPGSVSDHNLVTGRLSPDGDATILDLAGWQALGYDANSAVVDALAALFVSPGTDFHPLGAAAQMVDAGTAAVNDVVTDDMDGMPRPLGSGFDIGCYEGGLATGLPTERTAAGILLRAEGRVLVLEAPAVARLNVLDPSGRLVLTADLSGVPHRSHVPLSGPGLVCVYDGSGERLAVERLLFLE